jgi:hypothetical protein
MDRELIRVQNTSTRMDGGWFCLCAPVCSGALLLVEKRFYNLPKKEGNLILLNHQALGSTRPIRQPGIPKQTTEKTLSANLFGDLLAESNWIVAGAV